MRPKNGKEEISWGPILVGYLIILFIWLHCAHVASWCSGKYTTHFIAFTSNVSTYNVLAPSNWPLKVISFSQRSSAASGMDAAIYGMMEALQDPLNLKGTVLMNGGLIFVFATALYLGFMYSNYLRHNLYRQDIAGKEYGSAKWENDEDIKNFMAAKTQFYWRDWADKDGNPNSELQAKAVLNQNINAPDGFGIKPLRAKDALEIFKSQKKHAIEDPNILVGKTIGGKLVKYALDNEYFGTNVSTLVVGSSGAGKTFKYIKPSLAQMNSSFVVTDPSGEIMADLGLMLLKHGYNVKLFSTSDMAHSNCYNPFDYIYGPDGQVDQTKVAVFISTFMANADETKKGAKGGDDFWKKAPQAFMTAAAYYCVDFLPVEQRNMATILKLTQMGKTDESSTSSETELDKLFKEARERNSKSKCFSSYDTFKLAPAKTANSILISLGVDLNKFSDDNVFNMTTTDYLCKRDKRTGLIKEYIYPASEKKKSELEKKPIRSSRNIDLDKIGDEKTAVFINIPQANSAYNFLVSMMYTQLFDVLYTKAEKISASRFHIYDRYGNVLSSQYESEEKAQRFIELYKNAVYKAVPQKVNGEEIKRHYIFNEDAKADESDPEMGPGYLKEVYSEDVANNFINRYKEAYIKPGKQKLPVHVKCLLDEFANIGTIPNFDKILSTSRKYEISSTVVVQSFKQLEQMFDKGWEIIVGNCSTLVYLGSTENNTQEYMSKLLGKTTIRTVKESMSKQTNGGSNSSSFDRMQRDLMTVDEVGSIPPSDEIVIIAGKKFYLRKLSFAEHPHFKESGTYDKNNKLDEDYLEKHFKCMDKHTIDTSNPVANEMSKRQVSINHGGSGINSNDKSKPLGKSQIINSVQSFAESLGYETPEEMMKDYKKFADANPRSTSKLPPKPLTKDALATDDSSTQIDFGTTSKSGSKPKTPEKPETQKPEKVQESKSEKDKNDILNDNEKLTGAIPDVPEENKKEQKQEEKSEEKEDASGKKEELKKTNKRTYTKKSSKEVKTEDVKRAENKLEPKADTKPKAEPKSNNKPDTPAALSTPSAPKGLKPPTAPLSGPSPESVKPDDISSFEF